MATPRKKNRKYDKEASIRKMMDAISDILKTVGHTGLNEVQITNRSGHHRSLIRYHFHGLANLKKLYIREKDYWGKFFQRFRLSDSPEKAEVRQLFTGIMQENLRFFWDDPEMQKIILWQISEDNPLMRSVSEAREAEGARLLDKTDLYFAGTGTSFRTVIALLLGGIYYNVLHAKTNKSTVCGIDINREKDRQDMLRTIEQVIAWAWEHADKENKLPKTNPMNCDTGLIETIAADLAAKTGPATPDAPADKALVVEAKRLEQAISRHMLGLENQAQVETFLNRCLQKLVKVANTLYKIHESISPDTAVIMVLLADVKDVIPQRISPLLELPLAFIALQRPAMEQRWEKLQSKLKAQQVNPLLLEITGLPGAGIYYGEQPPEMGRLYLAEALVYTARRNRLGQSGLPDERRNPRFCAHPDGF